MMRSLALIPLLFAAGCSGGSEAPKQEEQAAAAAEKLDAGQWELTTEVTKFDKTDQGAAKIDTPVGTKASASHCIDEAGATKPEPLIFSGGEKDECTFTDFYMSGGRLNGTAKCNRPGFKGYIATRVDVDFTATTMEGTLDTTTYLTTDGDVRFVRKLTGKRTGVCTPEAAAGEKKA